MNLKNIVNKRTFALISLIITTSLFLGVLILPLSETVKLAISVIMIVLLVMWVSFATGGLPSLASIVSILLFFMILGMMYTSLLMTPSLNALASSSVIQSFFTMIGPFILISTHFPKRVKQAVQRWLIQKNQFDSDPQEINLKDQPGLDKNNSPVPYALYRQRRTQEILRSKPTSIVNSELSLAILRLVFFFLVFAGGFALVVIGSSMFAVDKMLSSPFVWMMVLGLTMTLVSFLIILEGFTSALKNALLILPVLVLLTLVLERVLSFYDDSMSAFVMAMTGFVMVVGILVYQWIQAITLRYTIALMMFKRGEVWLGVEQLLLSLLPIEHYDQLTIVEISVDDQFDLTELMFLGPKLERYTHARRIIFAGLRFDPFNQKAELYFCIRNQSDSDRSLTRFFKRHFHYPFTLTHLQDAKAILEARLTPTQDEMIEANNRNTVYHYEDEGVDLTQLHHIILILTFKDEISSNQAVLDLNQEGYHQTVITDTRRQPDLPASKDNGWLELSVQSETRLGLERINILTRQINQIIQPTQGILSYWVLGKFQESDQETQT